MMTEEKLSSPSTVQVLGLSKEIIYDACNPNKYSDVAKYPYINYLPFTTPSKKYIQFIKKHIAPKKPHNDRPTRLSLVRQVWAESNLDKLCGIKDEDNCKCSQLSINSIDDDNSTDSTTITVYRIEYNGSNLDNGVIIEVHGGGYCVGSAKWHFNYAELLSKLTGCIIFLLEYKLAPEYTLPYAVNELIGLYSYLLNDLKISSSKIAMTGDSAGGGMILLALQSIKYGVSKEMNLPQPCCIWLNSPWTNLANDNESNIKNVENELMLSMTRLNQYSDWAVGNKDGELNVIGKNNKKNPIYSPMFGEFDLCPMYFWVGACEILLDDTLICAEKAYKTGIEVRCDISPYLCHTLPTIINSCSEARDVCSKGCDWILQQFKKRRLINIQK